MKTKFCPRCKQDRMTEWFGDPKAPYAICLSCRVELNGKPKTKAPDNSANNFNRNCAICSQILLGAHHKICEQCEDGLRMFNNNPKLVARAASYLSGQLRQPVRNQKKKRVKARNQQLMELVNRQRADARDAALRFEHAISK